MLWLLPLLPLSGALLLYLVSRVWRRAWLGSWATALVLATLVLSGLAVWQQWQASYFWSALIRLRLELTSAGAVYALTVPLVAAPVIAHAALNPPPADPYGEPGRARLLALMLAFVGAMTMLVLAADMLTLLIAWELVGACSWALIAQRWWEPGTGPDAGWAFLVTRSGDLGLYAATAALYAGSGSFAYAAIPALDGPLLQVFAAGVLVAAAAKSAQLPFAPWLFAAMSGPVPVSALLHAATMVAAGVFLLVRLQPELEVLSWTGPVILTTGLATALAAGLVASVQGDAKKLLAASTSAHYGLMWIAVGAGYPGVALLHFVAHACMKAPLFLAVGTRAGRAHRYGLADLARAPDVLGLAAAALVATLALAGVAPLGAAWSKELIVTAAGHQGFWLALLVALAGALSALYATRLQLIAFGLPGRQPSATKRRSAEIWPIIILAVLTLGLSLLWWPGLRPRLEILLGLPLPPIELWELALSLTLVALGIAAGAWLSRRGLRHAESPILTGMAAWLGLPALARIMLLRPLRGSIRGLARADDWLLDAITSARLRLPSLGLARFDDRLLDAISSARLWLPSLGLARFDVRVVDAALGRIAGFGTWLAVLSAQAGEAAADALPGRAAWSAGRGGRWIQGLHSGLVHQYYLLVAAGLAVLALILGLGGIG